MKSEPDVYGWDDLVAEGEGAWDGVRNYTARNNLMAMAVGDRAFFYHSNIGKEIVGIVEIIAAGFPDPSDDTGKWVSVRVKPVEKLAHPVTLAAIKADARFAHMELVRYSRLSVSAVRPDEWKMLLAMAAERAA